MWDIFYTEVLTKMSDSTWMASNEWPGYFAKKYDECMKRGFDNTTKNKVKKGNVEAMAAFLQSAAAMALNSKDESFYKLYYVLIGNAVVQYWTGAELETTSTPLTPATGTLVNLYVTSNVVTNPAPKKFDGTTAPPIKNVQQFLFTFINLARAHLMEVGGVCYTFSQYPTPLPPGPGVLNWKGYNVETFRPLPSFASGYTIDHEDYKLTESELAWAREEIKTTSAWLDRMEADFKAKRKNYFKEKSGLLAAEEKILLEQYKDNTKMGINKDAAKGTLEKLKNLSYTTTDDELGARIVAWAIQAASIPVLETSPNHGPWVDMVMKRIGLSGDDPGTPEKPQYNTGYKWCAGAISYWFRKAGALIPNTNPASCRGWKEWAESHGTWTQTPGLGYACVYKNSNGEMCHIGIVADPTLNKNGSITTIEGNTSSKGFNRDGGGVFVKNPDMYRVAGYVKPTPDPAWAWT